LTNALTVSGEPSSLGEPSRPRERAPRQRFAKERLRTVALLVETSNDYARGLLRGVVAYIRKHRPWTTYLAEHGRGDEPPDWLSEWRGDGILARIENKRIAEAVVASGRPAVDLSAANLVGSIPWVETDDALIARAAFGHLRERGLRHFAYYGDGRFNWSNWRAAEFRRLCAEAGCPCEVLDVSTEPRSGASWTKQLRRTAAWVKWLPKPVGIMACYDILGRHVLEACRVGGVNVPDQAAVVGVDDDELLCELSDPPLSSVAPDTYRTGYEAAELLDRLMCGERSEPRAYLVPPLGVVVRKSSDMLAIDDESVSEAVRFIREHACSGIGVSDVLEDVPMSRRVLEARFKKLVGRSPHEEIERVRLERVQELLRLTDLTLEGIAEKTGFQHAEYLSALFKKRVGIPPSIYRKRHTPR
jgi:LacI family transcriptional regulator